MTNSDDIWNLIRTERLRLADQIQDLTPEQLDIPSQCEHWTVGEVAAHLITPFETSTFAFARAMVLSRGNFDKGIRRITARSHRRFSHAEIVDLLRAHADNRWLPPVKGAGPEIPFSEVVVHGQDIRRPLGLPTTVPDTTIERALAGIDDDTVRADYAIRIGNDTRIVSDTKRV